MIPLPYLPAPVRVLDLELSSPLSPIRVGLEYQALRILIRLRSRPIGWITIERPDGFVAEQRVREALATHLMGAVQNADLLDRISTATASVAAMPPISVVVCTRDRTDSLAHCLLSLLGLRYPDFEIIVVDNAPSSDATRRLVAALPVRYVREVRPGLDWARNRGISEARHSIVAFTDDDVQVDPQWLTGIAAGFESPDVMLVTGLICPRELETTPQIIFEYQYGGMGKGCQGWSWRCDSARPALFVGTHHLGAGANMAFRKEVFGRSGYFDTALDVGTPSHGGGDLDMFFRVIACGGTARYEPRALVWHTHRTELPALERQLSDNGRAFGVYLLTRFFEARRGPGTPSQPEVVRYIFGVWLAWLAGRVLRRIGRRETLALPLQFAEIRGALLSPWAFVRTRSHDRKLRRTPTVTNSISL